MKTVLVTGALGALGQVVIAQLEKNTNYRIIPTSRYSNNTHFQLDICNTAQLVSVINQQKPDLILNLAATFGINFNESYATHVEATRQLLEIIQNSNLDTRILLVGSAAEYGVVRPEDSPIPENHVLNPVSVYGLTKAWQTQLANFYKNRGVDVVVARIFNLDGPNISERLFIGRLQKQISDILAGRKMKIELGPLTAIRDYLSLDQAAKQILAIAMDGQSNLVYHVASGEPVTMRDMLMRYLKIHKLDVSIVHEADNLTNHIGYDVPTIYADITNTLRLIQKRTLHVDT